MPTTALPAPSAGQLQHIVGMGTRYPRRPVDRYNAALAILGQAAQGKAPNGFPGTTISPDASTLEIVGPLLLALAVAVVVAVAIFVGRGSASTVRKAVTVSIAGLLLLAITIGSVVSVVRPSSGVRGELLYVGGPAAHPIGPERRSVTAFRSDGSKAEWAEFGEGSSFELRLRPGSYRLAFESGDAACRDVMVEVRAGDFETVTARCGVM